MSESTIFNQLNTMRLRGFATGLREQIQGASHFDDMNFLERLGFLLQREMDYRQLLKTQFLRGKAKLKLNATVEAIDFSQSSRLNKAEILRLSSCEFIRKFQNLLITGPTGVGKTFLGCALADRALQNGIPTRYIRASLLYQELKEARQQDRYQKKLQEFMRVEFLILDDFGLEPLNHQQAIDLLEIMDQKVHRGSVAILTQISLSLWPKIIPEAALAEAILDRFIHTAIQIPMKGESMRKLSSSNSISS
jgi:DNA replication protein DnaC